jgi:RNA polymerase sigma-70 factor (ECF subfamily)
MNRRRRDTAQKRSGWEVSLEELSGTLSGPSLEAHVEARALGKAMATFLDTQSQTTRIIFLRRYWFGDSVKDIAKLLGMKESAVSVRLLRTREKLKDYLTEEGYYG